MTHELHPYLIGRGHYGSLDYAFFRPFKLYGSIRNLVVRFGRADVAERIHALHKRLLEVLAEIIAIVGSGMGGSLWGRAAFY